MDMIILLAAYYARELVGMVKRLLELARRNMKITLVVVAVLLYYRKKIMAMLKQLAQMSEQGLYKVRDMLMKNKMLAALVVGAVVLFVYMRRRRESFKYVLPDLKKELSAKDFGYVCSASSYSKKPELIQICISDVMGPSCYYKLSRETETGMEVITSGLFHKYVMHHPGSLLRFSDGELYKLLSRDPLVEPKDCSIVSIGSGEYDEADSNIPVTY